MAKLNIAQPKPLSPISAANAKPNALPMKKKGKLSSAAAARIIAKAKTMLGGSL